MLTLQLLSSASSLMMFKFDFESSFESILVTVGKSQCQGSQLSTFAISAAEYVPVFPLFPHPSCNVVATLQYPQPNVSSDL